MWSFTFEVFACAIIVPIIRIGTKFFRAMARARIAVLFCPKTRTRMPTDEYEVVSQGDDEIVVRDAATGHVFTFTVRSDVLNNRLLSRARFIASAQSDVRPEDIVVFVWSYAQRMMLEAGKIDQVIVA